MLGRKEGPKSLHGVFWGEFLVLVFDDFPGFAFLVFFWALLKGLLGYIFLILWFLKQANPR